VILLLVFLLRLASAVPGQGCPPGAVRYTVLVEDGLPEPGFTSDARAILEAPDGWSQAGLGELCYDPDDPNFAVLLAWPDTVDEMCAPHVTRGDVSCSRNGRAVINWKRWLNGSSGWASVADYRRYVLTHEVGHVLGMGHRRCPDIPGDPTPVMRQQTSLKHKSCPRNSSPTTAEVVAMAEKLEWKFRRLRRTHLVDPWERPPEAPEKP
jgi:hypothetical protein